jgi:flagellar hook assembly protein FlgD
MNIPHINYYQDYDKFLCQIGDINGDGEDEILINNAIEGFLGQTSNVYSIPSDKVKENILKIEESKISNYPNPFNPKTTINYKLPENTEEPAIEIFNIRGQLVIKLRIKDEGLRTNSVVWDGRDNNRNQVSSGIYLYRLIGDDKVLASQKMILLK